MTRRGWTLFIVVFAVALGSLWLARYFRERSQAAPPSVSSAQAPGESAGASGAGVLHFFREPVDVKPFSFTDIEGKSHTSSEWKGKVVLVNFWATWCPPCRAEIPDLIELQNRYRDRLVILGVSQDEGEGAIDMVKAFVSENKMNYLIAMSTPELQHTFHGVVALPTTFVIDPDSRMQTKHVGMLDAMVAESETRVLTGLDKNVTIERVENSDKVRLANAAQARTLPGVDLTGLTDEQRKPVMQALIDADCTCGCTLTVAECRLEDPDCPISLPLAKEIVKKHIAP
jgi:thiol-disulfide isomerase/thioredoxin